MRRAASSPASPSDALVPLRVCEGWTVSYNQFRAGDLKGSLLQATHARRDRMLDLGWNPEDDPAGAYALVVHVGDFTGPCLYDRAFTSLDEVVAEVDRLFDAVTRGEL